jgi:hypothetical protein
MAIALAFRLCLFVSAGIAQVPHIPEIPGETPSEREAERERGTSADGDIRNGHINGTIFPRGRPIHVIWKHTPGAYNAYLDGRLLQRSELQQLYAGALPVVNSGDVPRGGAWNQLTANTGHLVVIQEPHSANRTLGDIDHATRLGSRPLDPARTRVFNALPNETEVAASKRERDRMGIVGSREAWVNVNHRIRQESSALHSQIADKKGLLEELQHGNSHVVILYAHFDGQKLFLPGAGGATLSIDEIASLANRADDPAVQDRVIVLAACGTAADANRAIPMVDSRSLASLLLEKGIARTVLATDRPYDAREIPALMKRLASGTPLREAGGQLRQYVEVNRPARLHLELLAYATGAASI